MYTLFTTKAVTLNATVNWKKIAISTSSATMNAMMLFGLMVALGADGSLLGKMW
jgi:hypothetical protein